MKLADLQIAGLASYCWKGNDRVTATAVCLAESGGETTAGNYCCHGLWQVNTLAHRQYTVAQMQDPIANVKAACAIYHSQGWAAWESYTNGSYKQFIPRAQKAVGVNSHEAIEPIGPLGTQKEANQLKAIPGEVVHAAETAISWTTELGKLIQFISSSSGWVRIGKVALGGGLLFIAVDELLKQAPSPSAGPLASRGKSFAKNAAKAAIL